MYSPVGKCEQVFVRLGSAGSRVLETAVVLTQVLLGVYRSTERCFHNGLSCVSWQQAA